MPSPPQAMVRRSTSPHSDPLSIPHVARSGGLAKNPRVLGTRADQIIDSDSDPVANKSTTNSYTAGQAMDDRLTLGPKHVGPGYSQSSALPRAPTTTVRVTVVICSVVGGVIVVAAILALIYALRIRRRVRRIQGRTNVLGPGASPSP